MSAKAGAQELNASRDMQLISQNSQIIPVVSHRSFLFSTSDNWLAKYNPLTLLAGSMLYTYQNLISQQLSAGCLYEPSCSEFGKGAMENFGLFKGFFLAADRVNRCNRIAGMDIHVLRINEHTHKADDAVECYR